jgi:hypothetical protein
MLRLSVLFLSVCVLGACGSEDSMPADPIAPDADGTSMVSDSLATDAALDTSAEPGPVCDVPNGLRPSRRSEHAGTYDPVRHQLVFFGGSFAVPINCGYPTPTFETETWIYDIACDQWRMVEGSGPPGRARHMAAYDPVGDRMVVWGGRTRAGSSGPYSLMADLWALDLETETWSLLTPASTAAPAARVNAAMVVDAGRNRLLVFGGNTSTSGMSYVSMNDVWQFDFEANMWSPINVAGGPSSRLFTAALFDDTRDRLVIFGGADETAFGNTAVYFNDLWALEFADVAPQWVPLDAATARPDGRFWSHMVWADALDLYVLFGGHDSTSLGNRNDVYTFDPITEQWSELRMGDTYNKPANGFCSFPPDFTNVDRDSPERRNGHVFAGAGAHAWTTGGKTDCGVIDDLFELDIETGEWTELTFSTVGESCLRKGGLNCNDLCF